MLVGRTTAVFVLLLLTAPIPVSATTYTVHPDGPGDFPTIQTGLDGIQEGDSLLLSPGRFYENLFWPFRNALALIGAGMDTSVVVADHQVGLYMVYTEIDSTTIIQGIRFTKAADAGLFIDGASPKIHACAVDSTLGGPGIHCLGGSRTKVRDCTLRFNACGGIRLQNCTSDLHITFNVIHDNGNLCDPSGGGIASESSSPLIAHNTIFENFDGGIVCLYASSPTIVGNTIRRNKAVAFGGGILAVSSSPVIRENIIEENNYEGGGGGGEGAGICCSPATAPLILDNIIRDNVGTWGGGILCREVSGGIIRGNVVTGNRAQKGGGIFCTTSSLTIDNNWVGQNAANADGGGIAFDEFVYTALDGNTVVGNTAGGRGGGIFSGRSSLNLVGNVVAENIGQNGGGIHFADFYSTTLVQNTLTRNEAIGAGGAVFCLGDDSLEVVANTITENIAGSSGDAFYIGNYQVMQNLAITIVGSNIAANGWGIHDETPPRSPVARSNWWGDATGPFHQARNAGGRGDSLSVYAWDFVPWLSQAVTGAPVPPPLALQPIAWTGDPVYHFTWELLPVADLAGCRLYYDDDEPGYPYRYVVDVGNVTEYRAPELLLGSNYYVAVTCYDVDDNESWYSREVSVVNPASGITESQPGVDGFYLEAAVPNPFRGETMLRILGRSPKPLDAGVYDAVGRRVANLSLDRRPQDNLIVWNGRSANGSRATPGVYFVRVTAGKLVATRKVILSR